MLMPRITQHEGIMYAGASGGSQGWEQDPDIRRIGGSSAGFAFYESSTKHGEIYAGSGILYLYARGGSSQVALKGDSVTMAGETGGARLTANSTTVRVETGYTFTAKETMKMLERSAAASDTATYGQFWVKDDAPNTPWFTTDAGNDMPIASAAMMPRNDNPNEDITLDNGDAGTVWDKTTTTARTITLEASTSTTFPVGGVITIMNKDGSGNVSIAEGSGTTLYHMDGTDRTDTLGVNLTLSPGGIAMIRRAAAGTYDAWAIVGTLS
jgi:hypothetical protein